MQSWVWPLASRKSLGDAGHTDRSPANIQTKTSNKPEDTWYTICYPSHSYHWQLLFAGQNKVKVRPVWKTGCAIIEFERFYMLHSVFFSQNAFSFQRALMIRTEYLAHNEMTKFSFWTEIWRKQLHLVNNMLFFRRFTLMFVCREEKR